MSLIQRFLQGATDDGGNSNRRSPDQARPADLTDELRELKQEIRLLREAIGSTDAPRRKSAPRGRGKARRSGDSGRSSLRRPRRQAPRTPPDDAPVGLLVDYLRGRDIVTYEGSDDLSRNEAFEHLARHLGQHFKDLGPFYEKMKRAVAAGRGTRIDLESMSSEERSGAVQFGTLLHRHGLLKDFYYHRSPKKELRVIPLRDGEIAQFLTGGWLEMYVAWLLGRQLKARFSPARFQLLSNVKGALSDGREFESDLMAFVDGKLFWVECKTGDWQDYSARFKGLVPIFGADRTSAALLLIRPPDSGTRSRATDMLDMRVISIDEVEGFITDFLDGLPGQKGKKSRRRVGKAEEEPALLDEEPLENVEPAKKVGQVDLGGKAEDSDTPPDGRRRRRRRTRRPVKAKEGSEPKAEEKKTSSRKRPVKAKEGSEPKAEEKKTSPRKRPVKAKEKPKPEKAPSKSAGGVTIAPSLDDMIAGGPSK